MFQRGSTILMRFGVVGLLGFTLLCLSGCGKPKGTINGTVKTKEGKPVSAGSIVTVWSADGNTSVKGMTGPEGAYTVSDIPPGDVKVTLGPPAEGLTAMSQLKPKDTKQGTKASSPIPIPAKYQDKAKTPLQTTVENGKVKTFDITLD